MDMKTVGKANDFAIDGIKPDLTFLLDLPVNEGFKRMQPKNNKGKIIKGNQTNLNLSLLFESHVPRLAMDRIESEGMDFHLKVRQTFLSLASEEPERIVVLDANQTVKQISTSINQHMKALLDKHSPAD